MTPARSGKENEQPSAPKIEAATQRPDASLPAVEERTLKVDELGCQSQKSSRETPASPVNSLQTSCTPDRPRTAAKRLQFHALPPPGDFTFTQPPADPTANSSTKVTPEKAGAVRTNRTGKICKHSLSAEKCVASGNSALQRKPLNNNLCNESCNKFQTIVCQPPIPSPQVPATEVPQQIPTTPVQLASPYSPYNAYQLPVLPMYPPYTPHPGHVSPSACYVPTSKHPSPPWDPTWGAQGYCYPEAPSTDGTSRNSSQSPYSQYASPLSPPCPPSETLAWSPYQETAWQPHLALVSPQHLTFMPPPPIVFIQPGPEAAAMSHHPELHHEFETAATACQSEAAACEPHHGNFWAGEEGIADRAESWRRKEPQQTQGSPSSGVELSIHQMASMCFQASSKGAAAELPKAARRVLVEHQITSSNPLRAPWYRRHSSKRRQKNASCGSENVAGTGVWLPSC